MGNGCRKGNDNVYFRCRKEASEINDRLSSREGASELLGISESTLADYELGVTKVVPVDKVVLMADLYHCPELKNLYCKNECPIGKDMPIATEPRNIEGVVLRIMKEFDAEKIKEFQKKLIDIAGDGFVSQQEIGVLQVLARWADDMEMALSQFKLTAKKIMEG